MIKHIHRGFPPYFSGHQHLVIDSPWVNSFGIALERCPTCNRVVVRGMGRWWEYWVSTPSGIRRDPGE